MLICEWIGRRKAVVRRITLYQTIQQAHTATRRYNRLRDGGDARVPRKGPPGPPVCSPTGKVSPAFTVLQIPPISRTGCSVWQYKQLQIIAGRNATVQIRLHGNSRTSHGTRTRHRTLKKQFATRLRREIAIHGQNQLPDELLLIYHLSRGHLLGFESKPMEASNTMPQNILYIVLL